MRLRPRLKTSRNRRQLRPRSSRLSRSIRVNRARNTSLVMWQPPLTLRQGNSRLNLSSMPRRLPVRLPPTALDRSTTQVLRLLDLGDLRRNTTRILRLLEDTGRQASFRMALPRVRA